MADETPGRVAATLAARLEYYRDRGEREIASARDVVTRHSGENILTLVAAVEAALKQHQPVNRGEGLEPICGTCHKGFWPCPTFQAIGAALTGTQPSEDENRG